MGVTYRNSGSALVKPSERGIWRAGDRCPDVVLQRNGRFTRLYTDAGYGRFLAILVNASLDHDMAVSYTVGEGGLYSADWAGDEPYVVVVRPDMYVGCVGSEDEAREYLDDVFRM